jgi:hypothetical protein
MEIDPNAPTPAGSVNPGSPARSGQGSPARSSTKGSPVTMLESAPIVNASPSRTTIMGAAAGNDASTTANEDLLAGTNTREESAFIREFGPNTKYGEFQGLIKGKLGKRSKPDFSRLWGALVQLKRKSGVRDVPEVGALGGVADESEEPVVGVSKSGGIPVAKNFSSGDVGVAVRPPPLPYFSAASSSSSSAPPQPSAGGLRPWMAREVPKIVPSDLVSKR